MENQHVSSSEKTRKSAQGGGSNETRIHEVLEKRAQALHDRDPDLFLSLFSQDSVMYVLAPPLQFTAETSGGRKGVEEWFSTFRGPVDYETRDVRIAAAGDIAFCHCLHRLTGTRVDGKNTDMWLRETLCFRKEDDAWKIVHQHQSVPFYMDGSYKAAVDLKP